MSVRDGILSWIKTRKSPVTAAMIAKRLGCSESTASEAIRQLLKTGQAKETYVASGNHYIRGVLQNDKYQRRSQDAGGEREGSAQVDRQSDS
jgi:predicted transcriptional regulator